MPVAAVAEGLPAAGGETPAAAVVGAAMLAAAGALAAVVAERLAEQYALALQPQHHVGVSHHLFFAEQFSALQLPLHVELGQLDAPALPQQLAADVAAVAARRFAVVA